MPFVTTSDGTDIFYKDWGTGQPLFFHHGWPLSADDWDAQMMFFLAQGFRVIAHDRRGHGRSTQTAQGHDMDTYAADAAAVVAKLDLRDAIHIGHSTGGGEVARYVARRGQERVVKAVLISAIPPTFMQSERNPDGVPIAAVDQIRDGTANHRSQFYKDSTIPFYGYNRPGAVVSQGVQDNWWRQGMMGAIIAQWECVRVLSETEFFDDLAAIDVPVLVMHREDDQICPFPTTGARSVKLLKHGELKSYPARHADHPRRRDQPRPPGVHPQLRSKRRVGSPLCSPTPFGPFVAPGSAAQRRMEKAKPNMRGSPAM